MTPRGGAVYYAARREPATVSCRLVRAGGRRLHLYFRRFDPRPSRSARRCASVTTQPRPSPRVSARSVFGRCSSISPTLPAAPFSTCATRRSPRARRRVSAAEGHREAHLGDDITSQRDPSNDVLGCIEEVLHRLGSGHAAAGVAFIDAKTGTAQQALRQPGQHPPWRWPRRTCSSPGSRSRINTASLSRSGSDPVARSPGGGTTATQPGTRRQAVSGSSAGSTTVRSSGALCRPHSVQVEPWLPSEPPRRAVYARLRAFLLPPSVHAGSVPS